MNNLKNNNILFFAYILIYLPWFKFLENNVTTYHQMNTVLDNRLPFCKYFIVPYMLWFFYVAFGYIFFFMKSQDIFRQMAMFLTIGMTIGMLICTLFPNGLYNFRPQNLPVNDIFDKLVALLYRTDTSTNVFPSIHVYNSIGINLAIQRYNNFKYNKLAHFVSSLLCISICMATVLLKQHALYDVFGSILLAIVIYQFTFKKLNIENKDLMIGVPEK